MNVQLEAFSVLQDLISSWIDFHEIHRGSQVIGSASTATNKTGLAWRNNSVKTASTPRTTKAMKQLFTVILLLMNSFRLSSDSFFMSEPSF
ncbi:MAG: hypothetical protein DI538_12605 [Azospira oryzae]|nr:MAG: hypothetical protein DI538_12605 [Azospira oryzae]